MLKMLSRVFLALTGWTVHDDLSDEVDKCVIIAAPHTSNWDFPFTIAIASMLDLDFYWVGKHSLFRWPFGGLMRWLGGISIDRRKSNNYVEQLAESFEGADRMALAIAPEGTRSKSDRWKSGFYHIAHEAEVPIVLGYVDFSRKRGGLGLKVDSSQPKKDVMERIRGFYEAEMSMRPEQFTEPALRNESE